MPAAVGAAEGEGRGARAEGGGEASAPPRAVEEDAIVALGRPVPPPVAQEAVREVEGRPLLVEEFAGDSGYYRRYSVCCPLVGAAHLEGNCPCSKRRGTAAAQTRRFGHLEPVAFLAVWVRAASAYGTRAQHMAFVPSPASVEQYMREQGWL